MFFETNQVNDALLCIHCEERLSEPKILPCGETICSLCETNIHIIDKMYECLVCNKSHEMPEDGLPNNKLAFKMLSIKLTKVSRGEVFDSLIKLLDVLQEKTSLIKLGIENSDDFVKEHCLDLRSEVQLTTEEVLLQVNEISTKLIKQIDEYEQKLIKSNKINTGPINHFNKIVKEMELFHSNNSEYLKKYEVDNKVIKKSNEDVINLIKKAESEIENLKDVIFNGSILKFDKNKQQVNNLILGSIKIEKLKIDSFILLNCSQNKMLMSLCEFPINQQWNLIYRASQHGFEISKFHAKCGNRPNTLVIIKSTNGNVFGGYTEKSWTGFCDQKDNPNAFIFSLINKDNKPLKMKCKNRQAIYSHSSYGPTFGYFDILIEDRSNTNTNSYSDLGQSYTHPDYAQSSSGARSFLAGSYNFQVSEIEVYTKQ